MENELIISETQKMKIALQIIPTGTYAPCISMA